MESEDLEKTTIFEALKSSGEHFFNNKKELDNVRNDSRLIRSEAKTTFNDLKSKWNRESIQQIVELFDSLDLKEPTGIEYEKRRSCNEVEEEKIRQACFTRDMTENDIEDIKHALGFISQNQQTEEFKKPCVAVVGQTKSGKSSLINALLGAKVVPQKLTRQTARVTYVGYCKTKFVAFMKNNQLDRINVGEDVHNDDVDLSAADRRRSEEVNIEVRVGVDNPVLQNGFDVVDSPGLNENPALNELCKKMEKSLLPLLIYVIDGRDGLTESDVSDIRDIRDITPEIKVIYFVTKLDRSTMDRKIYERTKLKKKCKAGEELKGESDVDVANRRLWNVFKKLQKSGLIPPLKQNFTECPNFNGANLAAIQSFRIQKEKPSSDIDHYTIKSFRQFELNLLHELKNMIEEPLSHDIKSILTGLENVLEMATICASNIVEEKQEKLICLQKFEKDENALFQNQSHRIAQCLSERINVMLDEFESGVINRLQGDDFGLTGDRRRMMMQDPFYSLFLPLHEIRPFIHNSLKSQLEEFISVFLAETDSRLVDELQALVRTLCCGKYGRSSFEEMLKNRLYYYYDLTEECFLTTRTEFVHRPSRRQRVNRILSGVRDAVRNLVLCVREERYHARPSQDTQRSVQESEEEVRRVLSEFDRKAFINNICSKITNEFTSNHESFSQKMMAERKFLQSDLSFDDDERKCLKKFAKELALLYTRTFTVKTHLCLVFDPRKSCEPIGRGRQADLEKVYLIKQSQAIVKKTYHTYFKNLQLSHEARKLGLEVYYTSRLNDPHLLTPLGITKEHQPDGMKFSIYYPFIPNGSIKDYLDNGNILDEKTRLHLGIDIAQGLQHLHELKILHRDVTPKNILLRDSNSATKLEAVIADFGVLNALGFADKCQVGTPFYCPAEVYELELRSMGYTYGCDVYSFGITLWQLLTYKLRDEYNKYEPEFVLDCDHNKEEIQKRVLNGDRPERRSSIPDILWEFLEKCWDSDITVRPSFQDHSKVSGYQLSFSNTEKSIPDYLQKIYESLN